MLIALGLAIGFRSNVWNIGAEAQLYAGAIVAVLLGTGALGSPLVLPVSALAEAVRNVNASRKDANVQAVTINQKALIFIVYLPQKL